MSQRFLHHDRKIEESFFRNSTFYSAESVDSDLESDVHETNASTCVTEIGFANVLLTRIRPLLFNKEVPLKLQKISTIFTER